MSDQAKERIYTLTMLIGVLAAAAATVVGIFGTDRWWGWLAIPATVAFLVVVLSWAVIIIYLANWANNWFWNRRGRPWLAITLNIVAIVLAGLAVKSFNDGWPLAGWLLIVCVGLVITPASIIVGTDYYDW